MADPIKDIVKKVIKEASAQQKSFETEITESWETLTPPKVREHTKLLKINKGTLFVLVDHPSWQFEISRKYLPKILKDFQEKFDKEKIKKIVLTVGNF